MATNRSSAVRLYHLRLPSQLQADRVVSGVVLPSVGRNTSDTCTRSTLHVLAVSLGATPQS